MKQYNTNSLVNRIQIQNVFTPTRDLKRKRSSGFETATGLRVGRSGVYFPEEVSVFSLFQNVHTGSGY